MNDMTMIVKVNGNQGRVPALLQFVVLNLVKLAQLRVIDNPMFDAPCRPASECAINTPA